ncbi:MAG: hypothetical protein FD146_1468 [Anaerolineaceae bacterium]|nr:MAG: hypothetical protein FD146_1468 [Anaerolineaceae bacterium]
MNFQKLFTICGILLALTLVVGCDKSNDLPKAPSQVALSATSTLIPSPTLTPVFSPTPTIIPTLPANEADAWLLDLLANNGHCRLPCLWGITPGESTSQNVLTTLVPLTDISTFAVFGPTTYGSVTSFATVSFSHIEGEHALSVGISILGDNDTVSYIGFDVMAGKATSNGIDQVFDWSYFGDRVSYYLLPNILTEYGAPSSVLIFSMAKIPPDWLPLGYFKVILLYPEQGIFIRYDTADVRSVGENVQGCLSNAHVDIVLAVGASQKKYINPLPSEWQDDTPYYLPLEEATSMSVDEFYHTFSQATVECLETPANLWPVAEDDR